MPGSITWNRPKQEEFIEARQAIDELCATFLDAYNRGDAAALATGYTEDCAVMVPNQQTVHGKLGVEMFFKEMIKEFGGTASLETSRWLTPGISRTSGPPTP